MKTKLTPIAAAAAVALAGAIATPAFAQNAAAPAAAASSAKLQDDVQHVEVTGIRGSLQQSINQKRNSETHVDVITAEDVGKLPDKNIADSLQHVAGVTISSAGANEGGFDESDRVSMRGTSPSLTQTLINGHNVASGDWFVLNQSDTTGRSVSYTLLPSEVVGSVIIHKTSQASLVEGGVAGSVDIISRKPLDFKNTFSANASVGAVYSDLAKKGDGQFSGLVSFKNEASTAGFLLQVFHEKRHLRRDGVEDLGYETIAPGSAVAVAHPDLSGVFYPTDIGSALFTQERERTGAMFDAEFKPNANVTLDINGFYSKLLASNYNRNYLQWDTNFINKGAGQSPSPGYVVRNNTLVSATFTPTYVDANGATQSPAHGIYDMISRPGEGSDTKYLDVDGTFRVTDKLKIATKVGTSNGKGVTPTQDVMEFNINGTGAAYTLNGSNTAPSVSFPGGDTSTPANATLNWIFGLNDVKQTDTENWQQLDADYDIDLGPLTSLKFGARSTDHKRQQLHVIAQGPIGGVPGQAPVGNPNFPQTYQTYPSNFGSGLGSGFPTNIWYYSPAQLAAFDKQFTNRDPVQREYFNNEFGVYEKTQAGYIQGNLEGTGWSGDVGLRVVGTQEHVLSFQPATDTTPGAIVGSLFGAAIPVHTRHDYTDLLPSGNLRFDLNKSMVMRFAASRTMTRADYSALAGTVNLSPPAQIGGIGTGSGGNPDLKPITSNNLDASFEWYFADRSLASASVFYMDLTSYIGLGQVSKTYKTFDANSPAGRDVDYTLSVPINSSGKVKGIELSFEQPLFNNFGVNANYTYTDAKEDGGGPIVGASKNTFNVGAYFENDLLNARVSYNHRSAFYSGLDRETAFNQAAVGDLSATLGVKVNKYLAITLDGRNLNNPKLKYYALNKDQPRSIYENGRQYYLTARFTY